MSVAREIHRFWPLGLVVLLAACGGAASPSSTAASTAASAAAKPSTGASVAASAGASAAAVGQMRKAKLAYATLTPLFLPPLVGVQAGIYQKHSMDLETTYSNNGPATMAALAGGDVQFAELADPSVTTSALEGSGVQWIAVSGPKPNLVLWVKPEIKSMQDLKGKKIGVTTLGSVTGLFALFVIKQNKMEPQKDIQVVQVGGPTEQRAALAANAIDAAVGDPEGPYTGVNILVDFRQGFPFPMAGIAISKTFGQKEPELVQDFTTAFVESVRRFQSDTALDVQVDMKALQRNEEDAKKEVDGAIKVLTDDVSPKPDQMQTTLDLISDTNAKAKTAKPTDFFDDKFAKVASQQAAK